MRPIHTSSSPDHPSTLQSRNNVASAYQDAGRTEETNNYDP
jgi:hypothetical protein